MPSIARMLSVIMLSGSFAGCAIVHSEGFSFPGSSLGQSTPEGLVLSAAPRFERHRVDIPPLLHAEWKTPPYDLLIGGWDEQGRFSDLHVSEVVLQYGDGTSIRSNDGWEAEFEDASPISGQNVDLKISEISRRHEDFTLTLREHVETDDGVRDEFVITRNFIAESDTAIGTWVEYVRAI